jgi:hypothetical protein
VEGTRQRKNDKLTSAFLHDIFPETSFGFQESLDTSGLIWGHESSTV